MQLENIKELLYRSENSKEKIAESDTKIRDKEEYVGEMEVPLQFFQEEKKEKKDRKWQPAAGCAVGVLFLFFLLFFFHPGPSCPNSHQEYCRSQYNFYWNFRKISQIAENENSQQEQNPHCRMEK